MGGPPSEGTQNQITQQQLSLDQQAQTESTQDNALRQQLMQPAINFNTAIASGNRQAALQADAPVIGQIDAATNASKESIFDTVGPGAARDLALAQNTVSGNAQKATSMGNTFLNANNTLASLGSTIGGFSLNELGGAISAGSSASSSNQAVMQAQEQSKASTMGFLGSLAGGAGSALSGTSFNFGGSSPSSTQGAGDLSPISIAPDNPWGMGDATING